MPAFSVHYSFSQHFNVSAAEAYKWSTDYQPNDLSLMGERGDRKIRWVSEDTVILTDTLHQDGKPVEKKKLVRLDAENLSWSNTHLAGPNKYSQFLYHIVPDGKGSRLYFTGLELIYNKTQIKPENIRMLERKEKKTDATAWKRLAEHMEKELSQAKSSGEIKGN